MSFRLQAWLRLLIFMLGFSSSRQYHCDHGVYKARYCDVSVTFLLNGPYHRCLSATDPGFYRKITHVLTRILKRSFRELVGVGTANSVSPLMSSPPARLQAHILQLKYRHVGTSACRRPNLGTHIYVTLRYQLNTCLWAAATRAKCCSGRSNAVCGAVYTLTACNLSD